MATLDAETGSRGSTWRVRFLAPDNRRITIRLGRIPKRTAESAKVRIELLVAARIAGHSIDAETALWVSSLSDGIHARLVKAGLVAPREEVVVPEKTVVRLGDHIDRYIQSRAKLTTGNGWQRNMRPPRSPGRSSGPANSSSMRRTARSSPTTRSPRSGRDPSGIPLESSS